MKVKLMFLSWKYSWSSFQFQWKLWKIIKKASSRLPLLEWMRCYLKSKAAQLILHYHDYTTVSILKFESWKLKYNSLDRAVQEIKKLNVSSIENLANR